MKTCKKTGKFRALFFACALVLFPVAQAGGLGQVVRDIFTPAPAAAEVAGLEGPVRLLEVTDGDTIVVRLSGGQEERVRLIGVDAPELYESAHLERDIEAQGMSAGEIQDLGQEAHDFTEAFLSRAPIYLEPGYEPRDRYDRLLAYIYTPDEQGDWEVEGRSYRQLNFEIIRAGWAEMIAIEPNTDYEADYQEAEDEAIAEERGMWARGWRNE